MLVPPDVIGALLGLDIGTYVVLRSHLNRGAGRCDPSVTRLASLLGVSHDTVQRSLERIEVAGKIVIHRAVGRRNFYQFPDTTTRIDAGGENRITSCKFVAYGICGPTNHTQDHTQVESRK